MLKLYSILSLLAVAGCTSTQPSKFIWKPGVSAAGKQSALDQCRIASFKEIPQTVVSETRGGYYNPGTLQCNTIGGMTSCHRVGAVSIPPTTDTYDINAGLRGRFIDRCLVGKGFTVTVLPACKSEADTKAATATAAQGGIPKCSDYPA